MKIGGTSSRRPASALIRLSLACLTAVLMTCASPPPDEPDLVVKTMDKAGPSIPNPPLVDRPVSFDALVVNNGTQPVKGAFNTVLEIDGKKVKTWPFPSSAEKKDALPGKTVMLQPGSSRLYTYVVQKIGKGKHTLRWIVDPENQIDEQNEGAQSNELKLTVEAQLPPDLVVDIQPETIPNIGSGPVTGQQTQWQVVVTNEGFGNAYGPFVTLFSSTPTSQLVPPLAFPKKNYLKPKQSHTFIAKQLYTLPGSVTVSATVDYQGNVTESLYGGETNNSVQKTYPLKAVDLDVYYLAFSPTNPTTADVVDIVFTVRNKGGMNASQPFNFGVQVQDQPPAGYGQSHVLTAKPLPANMSVQMSQKVTLPKTGQYKVLVNADASVIGPNVKGAQYIEPDEQNNLLVKMLTVKPEPVKPVPPSCKPGKDKVTLLKQTDNCPTGLTQAYVGIISPIKNGKLLKITNNSAKWRVKIIEQFNAKGQIGNTACESHGGLCHNAKVSADLSPGQSWSSIKYPGLDAGFQVKACLEPAAAGANQFPSKVDLEYDWTCK